MSDAVEVALIAGLPAIVASILGYLNSAAMRKQATAMATLQQSATKTEEHMDLLEKNTNSIKDALVKVTGEKAYAEGVLDGKKADRGL